MYHRKLYNTNDDESSSCEEIILNLSELRERLNISYPYGNSSSSGKIGPRGPPGPRGPRGPRGPSGLEYFTSSINNSQSRRDRKSVV